MRRCRDTLTQVNFDRIVKEAYNDISASFRGFDSDTSSSGPSVEVVMEIIESFDQEVTSYDHNSIDEVEIAKLRSLKNISSIGNEDYVILEPCILGECVCIVRPRGAKDEHFHFYARVLEDFNIHLPLTNFEFDLLKTLNVAPSQLCPNSLGFIKALEIVCEAIDIEPTIGLFSSFFEIKGFEKGGWVTLIGLPGKSFLQAYITNYKGFKD